MSSLSLQNNDQKRRITKTEKIAELQGKLKIITEENRRLKGRSKRNLLSARLVDLDSSAVSNNDSHTRIDDGGGDKSVGTSKSHGERDKLKEALRALKRATVTQEVSLATLRQKARQRRSEIDQKGVIIEKLQQENKAFRIAHEKMKDNGRSDDDVSVLRSQLFDLELQLALAKEGSSKEEREAGISSPQTKLGNMIGRGVRRTTSNGNDSHGALSMASDVSSSTSGEDVARLKKELARKSEKLTNLQHELEAYKDEVHDLKQRNQFRNAFPTTPALGDDDDFFDDNDNDADEDFWGNFE